MNKNSDFNEMSICGMELRCDISLPVLKITLTYYAVTTSNVETYDFKRTKFFGNLCTF